MALKFSRLDRPSIRGLASGQKITEHGITAERMADGNVRYSVNVMVDRQRIHRVIGKESDGVTRSHCEAFIEKARTEAREGRLDLPRGRKTHRSFREAADDYVKRLEETAGKNVKAKRRQLKKYLTPFFNDQRLDAITSFTVDRYKKRRIDHGAAAGTVNRSLQRSRSSSTRPSSGNGSRQNLARLRRSISRRAASWRLPTIRPRRCSKPPWLTRNLTAGCSWRSA